MLDNSIKKALYICAILKLALLKAVEARVKQLQKYFI